MQEVEELQHWTISLAEAALPLHPSAPRDNINLPVVSMGAPLDCSFGQYRADCSCWLVLVGGREAAGTSMIMSYHAMQSLSASIELIPAVDWLFPLTAAVDYWLQLIAAVD